MLLRALTVIFLFQFLGEFIAALSGLPLPGPVLGMILLFACLVLRGQVPEGIAKASDALLVHLSLLFLPAGAGLILHTTRIANEAAAIGVAVLASTILTVAATGLAMQFFSRKARD